MGNERSPFPVQSPSASSPPSWRPSRPQACGSPPRRCCGARAPERRSPRSPGGTRRNGGRPIGGWICGWSSPRRRPTVFLAMLLFGAFQVWRLRLRGRRRLTARSRNPLLSRSYRSPELSWVVRDTPRRACGSFLIHFRTVTNLARYPQPPPITRYLCTHASYLYPCCSLAPSIAGNPPIDSRTRNLVQVRKSTL